VPTPAPQAAQIVLSEAPPELYLAWTAFTVAAEQHVRDRPPLLSRASRAGFVTTPAAHLAHATILGPITEQCEAALRDGTAMVAPILVCDPEELAVAVDYLQRWGEWLGTSEEFREEGIPLPAPEVAAIRTAALKAIREQLDHAV
jgi:hypothetical protein